VASSSLRIQPHPTNTPLATQLQPNPIQNPAAPAGEARDLGAAHIFDLHSTKWWALKLATEAAVTVLRIDQIIMAKMAGGPKPRGGGAMDDED